MKTFEIAGIKIKNIYVQAPLAGYSTFAMRELAREYGAGLTYTEMTSCSALLYSSERTLEMLPTLKEDGPVALQLFSGRAEDVVKSIEIVQNKAVYDFIDFNCGCPVPKVIKQGAGSAWMKREGEIYDLAHAMCLASSHPVIFKIRAGFDNEHINCIDVGKLLENAGVKAIAIHGRTRPEGFSGPVRYELISELKKSLDIPVIANGSIDLANIDEVERITGADGYMFGRAALGHPKIFEDLINHENRLPIRENTLKEQAGNIMKHLEMLIKEKGEPLASITMRGISITYLKGIDNTKELRMGLVQCSSYEDYKRLLSPFI
jgi:nifR3 family TIM-barrel protein